MYRWIYYVYKVQVNFTLRQSIKSQAGIELQFHSFFNLGPRWRVGGQRDASAALIPIKKPDTNCTGGWVGPMDGYGRTRPTEIRSLDRPARGSNYTNWAIPCIRSTEDEIINKDAWKKEQNIYVANWGKGFCGEKYLTWINKFWL